MLKRKMQWRVNLTSTSFVVVGLRFTDPALELEPRRSLRISHDLHWAQSEPQPETCRSAILLDSVMRCDAMPSQYTAFLSHSTDQFPVATIAYLQGWRRETSLLSLRKKSHAGHVEDRGQISIGHRQENEPACSIDAQNERRTSTELHRKKNYKPKKILPRSFKQTVASIVIRTILPISSLCSRPP